LQFVGEVGGKWLENAGNSRGYNPKSRKTSPLIGGVTIMSPRWGLK